jgi:glutathione S-transferase
MSRGLGDKAWCAQGVQITLADIAVGCTLGWLDFRFPELGWRERHANLARLLDERLMQRPSFADTMPG